MQPSGDGSAEKGCPGVRTTVALAGGAHEGALLASARASSTPTVARASSSGSSSKASPAISRDTVNPMPDRAAPPST